MRQKTARGLIPKTCGTALLLLMMGAAQAKNYTVIVRAENRDYREVPVHVTIDAPKDFAGVALLEKSRPIPVQARRVGGKTQVSWIVRNLKKGESIRYKLAFEPVNRPAPTSGVLIDRNGANLDIRLNNELFTRYDTTTGPNKPYFYPLLGPGGKHMTRRYPLEKVPGEEPDHPHHRGMWFTHGAVNGEDYWSEGARAAKTVHRQYDEVASGPVYGYFRAVTDWITKDGKKAAEDVREVCVYNVTDGRLLDFEVTVRATEGPLVFGDTKEGSFGIRVPESIRVKGGGGHIETAAGHKDADAWGKRAEWVDYYGPVEGETLGIAILDHPQNLRHPTYWHVRDYGLFAVNPFGLHDFTGDRANPKVGDYTIPAGGSLTFRYRIFLHRGTTSEARIACLWAAYADPPKVEAR